MRSNWWQSGVFYQIYPRSWNDSDGDGVGDLVGIIERLDHLEWLGVDGIWLNPTTPSPNDDWGYDVSDYRGVHPELGTMADLEKLLDETARRDIKVLLDLVPNHTSSAHRWFVDACSSRSARHRDWYFWADPAPGGAPPNNWISVFAGEPAWEWHAPTGQYYLHNFLKSQPDLNWMNPEVRAEFRDILAFWFDKGVAGFRLDVAHALVSDQELRDNPAATDKDPAQVRRIGQQQVYNMNRPETHDILREWRRICDDYRSPRILVGETYVYEYSQLATYYGSGVDELNLAFNFPFLFSSFGADELRSAVDATLGALPEHAIPVWAGSNHDTSRFPTRWCDGDPARVRCALMMLLTLPGSSFLYYGDEIGMTDVDVDIDDVRDPVGKRRWPEPGRDPMRTPMQWVDEPGAGFTEARVRPWLPLGDHAACNVAAQRTDPSSRLNLTRDLIRLRRSSEDLNEGAYRARASEPGTWIFERGSDTVVALNLGEDAAILELEGRVVIATDRAKDGCRASTLELPPSEGVVVQRASETPLA